MRTKRAKVTGFAGVHEHINYPGSPPYFKTHGPGREYLGSVRSAGEAALAYARHLGPEQSAAAAAATAAEEGPPPSEAEVRRQAAAEACAAAGSDAAVIHRIQERLLPPSGRWQAYSIKHDWRKGRRTGRWCQSLGIFRTPAEGALAYARWLGPGRGGGARGSAAACDRPVPAAATTTTTTTTATTTSRMRTTRKRRKKEEQEEENLGRRRRSRLEASVPLQLLSWSSLRSAVAQPGQPRPEAQRPRSGPQMCAWSASAFECTGPT